MDPNNNPYMAGVQGIHTPEQILTPIHWNPSYRHPQKYHQFTKTLEFVCSHELHRGCCGQFKGSENVGSDQA